MAPSTYSEGRGHRFETCRARHFPGFTRRKPNIEAQRSFGDGFRF